MNNEQFGFGLKITICVTCIILVAVTILVINVLKNEDTSVSVVEEVPGTTGEAQIENEDEFKKYLEAVALLVREENSASTNQLETVFAFLSAISGYETFEIEEGYVCYDKQIVESAARELLAVASLETSEDIILDEKYNAYRYAFGGEFACGTCMDILSITKEDNIYIVEYTSTFPDEGYLYDLAENKTVSLQTYKIKATIQKNENYEYSKYYLKNIELLSKDIVQYN